MESSFCVRQLRPSNRNTDHKDSRLMRSSSHCSNPSFLPLGFRSARRDDVGGDGGPAARCWPCLSAWLVQCWKNPSGCPRSPAGAAGTPAQTPAGSPRAAGPTEPTSPETETPRSGASCWPAAAAGFETPPGRPARVTCVRTLQLGGGPIGLSLRWGEYCVERWRRREEAGFEKKKK